MLHSDALVAPNNGVEFEPSSSAAAHIGSQFDCDVVTVPERFCADSGGACHRICETTELELCGQDRAVKFGQYYSSNQPSETLPRRMKEALGSSAVTTETLQGLCEREKLLKCLACATCNQAVT